MILEKCLILVAPGEGMKLALLYSLSCCTRRGYETCPFAFSFLLQQYWLWNLPLCILIHIAPGEGMKLAPLHSNFFASVWNLLLCIFILVAPGEGMKLVLLILTLCPHSCCTRRGNETCPSHSYSVSSFLLHQEREWNLPFCILILIETWEGMKLFFQHSDSCCARRGFQNTPWKLNLTLI